MPGEPGSPSPWPDHAHGRLAARPPGVAPVAPAPPGTHVLAIGAPRPALLYVPADAPADRPLPLVLGLHGAGAGAPQGLGPLARLADRLGFLVVAPSSAHPTWDLVQRGAGLDVPAVDAALAAAFARRVVDPARIAVSGFSDGASFALALGLANGDLFADVLAFSPGFSAPPVVRGRPRVFVSHGLRDAVLPIDRCSRRIVPALRADGYDVRYREFDGGHAVPEAIAEEALTRFLAG